MSSLDDARDTQLRNIESKTGKTIAELRTFVVQCGLSRHGEIRELLIKEFNLGYGDANTLVHFALSSDGQSAAETSGASLDDLIGEIYSGKNEILRPIHDQIMSHIQALGAFEIAPKKGYLSLRRKRQFAMVGPASKGRVEVGLNMKGVNATLRLLEQPPGGMCQYKVFLSTLDDVDMELLAWIQHAYNSAG